MQPPILILTVFITITLFALFFHAVARQLGNGALKDYFEVAAMLFTTGVGMMILALAFAAVASFIYGALTGFK